jgi:hypothetical protein
MKLPSFEQATIPQAKITEYLLSLSHEDGRSKAKLFMSFGFSRESWEELAEALRNHAMDHEVTNIETSPFGIRYIIEGEMIR